MSLDRIREAHLDIAVPFGYDHAVITLRDRQAELARSTIIDALVSRLEAGDEKCSIEEVALDAGVSRRTLYRYFPSREELYGAAADAVFSRIGQIQLEVVDAAAITESFIAASKVTEKHPLLSRALLRAPAGRGVRNTARKRRNESIERAVVQASGDVANTEARQLAAVISLLCNSQAFIALQDDSGLTAAQSRAAIVSAIEVLLDDVRRRSGRGRAPGSAGGSPSHD